MSAVLNNPVVEVPIAGLLNKKKPRPEPADDGLRHDWTHAEVQALFELPFNDLLFQAHSLHRQHFEPNTVQLSTLLSIKTGACPEDCA
ncbi:MAG: hypothetical protein ACREVL_12445, partial [Solimonas sp.]